MAIEKAVAAAIWLFASDITAFGFHARPFVRFIISKEVGHSSAVVATRSTTASRSSKIIQWASLDTVGVTTSDNDISDTKDEAIGAWIPIASVTALRGLGPQRVTVMGLDLVVWEDLRDESSSTWAVQMDECTHRLAPLSQGRVDPLTNCIECPYHGWQFDTSGTLTRIPQLTNDQSVEQWQRAGHLHSFPVHRAGDILFAFMPSSVHGEIFPQSMLPEQMFPSFREAVAQNFSTFVRELPYSFDFLVENFMDPGHIPFAHNTLQGVRSDARPIPMEELVFNFTMLEVSYKHQVRGKIAEGIVSYQRPTMFHFRTLNPKTGNYTLNLNIHVVPVRAGWCRVLLTFRLATSVPRWLVHGSTNRFLNSDIWLHDTEIIARRKSQTNEKYLFATTSDLGAQTFRRWWKKYGFSSSPPNAFGPASPQALQQLTRREQIDPWQHHTKQCSSCRKGLATVKKAQRASWAVAAASPLFLRLPSPWSVPAFAVTAALAMGASLLCYNTATFIEGNPRPSGNTDRSVAAIQDEANESRLVRFIAKLTAPKRPKAKTTTST